MATLAQGGLSAAAQAQAGHAPNAAAIVVVVVVVGAVQAQQGPLANAVAPPAQAAQPPANTTPGQPHTVIPSTIHECMHSFPSVSLILMCPRSRRAAVERSERVSNRRSPQQPADLDVL